MRYILLGILMLGWSSTAFSQDMYKRTLKLMGCRFDVTVVAADQAEANRYIDTAVYEMQRIEKLISSWDPASQTSQVNAAAGVEAVSVDQEVFDLIERAVRLSQLTDGAFDISYASMDRIWKFDGSMQIMPDPATVQASVARVGFKKIRLNRERLTVFLPEKGMKLGFGAIGKGYAADQAKRLLQELGVEAGIINASGDMNTWGTQPNGDPWKVAITNPMRPETSYGLLPIEKGAVVTSGNYEKFVLLDGERYAHIIDPRTGYPAKGMLSVTVFAPQAELADALATSIFVMGIEVGLNRINQIPGVECIIVDDKGDLHTSEQIEITTL